MTKPPGSHFRATGFAFVMSILTVLAGDPPKAPVPKSPYIAIVDRYADTLLEKGRDDSGVFYPMLDRATLLPLTRGASTASAQAAIHPLRDENFLRLLYFLTELRAKPKYREAADRYLRALLQNAGATSAANAAPWDEQRSWMLWERLYALDPEISRRLSLDLTAENSTRTNETVRWMGFCIRSWAAGEASRKDPLFANAIEKVIDRMPSLISGANNNSVPGSVVSLAIDCAGAAHLVGDSRAVRLRQTAGIADDFFCGLPHDLGRARDFVRSKTHSATSSSAPQWIADKGEYTTAQIGMMCVSRYDNSARTDYRRLLLGAADVYMNQLPPDAADVLPGTFGHVISLELAAWRHTAKAAYLERARTFGDLAMEKFFGTNALPRASLKREHYESGTGADTLALALAELHLHVLHITAVRCPPNTIDR